MTRLTAAAWLAASALALAGCSNTVSDGGPPDVGPTDTTSGNNNPAGGATVGGAAPRALFAPLSGLLPYPTDLYFSGTTDGTLNIPANPFLPNAAQINQLDGYSTTAPISIRFSTGIDPATLTAANVRVVQVTIDNATKATTGLVRPLVLGTDFSAELATDAGAGGTDPAAAAAQATDRRAPARRTTAISWSCTNGLRDAAGAAVAADTDYANIKAAQPTCAAITNATLNGVCRLTGAHLQIAGVASALPRRTSSCRSASRPRTRATR